MRIYQSARKKNRIKTAQQFFKKIITTDSEWDTNLSDPWLSTAFASARGTVVYVRDDLSDDVKQRLQSTADELQVKVFFVKRTDDTDLSAEVKNILRVKGKARLTMFYSPKDVEYAVGWQRFKNAIEANKVRQRNNISGKMGDVIIKDVCGWAGKTSLAKFAAMLGIPMLNKGSMDLYKSCMMKALTECPEEFLRYAVDDAKVLLEIVRRFVEMIGTIQRECLGMSEEDKWNADDIPMTCGALVAKTFERWLYTVAGEDKEAMKFCNRKLGILDPDDRNYRRLRWKWERAVNDFRSLYHLESAMDQDNETLNGFFDAKCLYTALDSCGIKWFANLPATDSACYNALVQGGRCLNENPFEYRAENGLDIDISGCYGESLRSMIFPVGLPTVWSYTPNERKPTLAEWLDRNERHLIDGLWTCVVSGNLSYEQDLIYSKLVKASNIRKAVWSKDQEDSDIPSDFVMLRREIRNGIVTSDVLKTIRAVATNTEWQELRNLEVITACAYLREHRKDDVRQWCEEVISDRGRYGGNRAKVGGITDSRSRAWYGVPLEMFVGKLVDERRQYKRLGKDTSLPDDQRAKYQGLDGMLKLMVNTLYGVLASRYFTVGNTVLANNITARARVGVWMVAKALGLRQCITDGGIYTPDKVSYFSGKKPGLDTLSRQWEWHDTRRGRSYRQLPGWESAQDLDSLAMDHVRDFWLPYGLTLPFKLEHKMTNRFTQAAYWSKGDYALNTSQGTVYAVRGKDKNKRTDRKQHPSFALLDNILNGSDDFPSDLTYIKGGILKIGKWLLAQSSNGFEDLKALRPGDNLPDVVYTARYNNTHFPIADEQDYLKRRNRHKIDRGKTVPWFERYAPKGISGVHRAMILNKFSRA